MKLTNRKLLTGLSALLLTVGSATTQATPFAFWNADGWTAMVLDNANEDGQVGPGAGGQKFDAEGLYVKQSGNILSIGLQAGYNIVTGYVYDSVNPKHYYAGDLALSFDGSAGTSSSNEYAVDFGLLTKDYQLHLVENGPNIDGIDPAGLYSVSLWNNDVYAGHASQAAPFAMETGTLITGLISNNAGSGSVGGQTSYCRTVSFDLASLGLSGPVTLDAHWTMSCGNDVIRGTTLITSVPEPGVLGLMMLSLLGLVGLGRKRFARA